MHICFASLDYPDETGGGGVGIYVNTIGHELFRKGHRVSVIAPKKTKTSPDITDDKGVKIYRVNIGNVHWYVSKLPVIGDILSLPIRELEYSMAVYKCIRNIHKYNHIDIVEGTETGAYYFSRLRAEIKTIIRLHGETYTFLKYTPPRHIPLDVRLSRYLQKKSLLRSHKLISPSFAHADEVRTEMKAQKISIEVIPNPVPVPGNFNLEERRPPDLNHPLFLFVGRLERRKGLIPLLKAIPGIIKNIPEAKFVFAGTKHPTISSNEIEYLIEDLGVRKSIVFLGHVRSAEMKALYMKVSAVVLPSYYETFGYVYLEALMYGVPIIACDIGSARDFIVNGKNGFLVPVDDIDALADACIKAINISFKTPDPDEFAAYDTEIVCEEIIKVYNDMLGNTSLQRLDRPSPTSTLAEGKMLNVFLSPHFDDAVFSCGGLIHERVLQGQDVLVVTIFGGIPDYSRISLFAKEIHNKWKAIDPVSSRRSEDIKAIEELRARLVQLDFPDSIYRQNADNHSLYSNYEDLKGTVHPSDNHLSDHIYDRLIGIIQKYAREHIRIFSPLGIGNHVDHQIVKTVGMRLLSEDFNVFFYEELPYCFWDPDALNDFMTKNKNGWSYNIVPIDINAKLNAIKHYNSQFAGLGGTFRTADKRFKKYALSVGNGKFAERVWTINKN
jgi:glycosyltransferase involved in cell wall biosynthesis/LmbE family N-acetylglucosaminyl deacetylase